MPHPAQRVINNPFFGSAASGLKVAQQVTPGDPSQQNESKTINTQMARSLLLDEGRSEAHKRRLRRIVAAGADADELKRLRAVEDAQFRLIQQAAANPSDPLTGSELNQAVTDFRNQTLSGSVFPDPVHIRKEEEETDNTQLKIVNMAESLSERFNVPVAYARSLLLVDPKTGKLPQDAGLKAAQTLFKESTPSTGLTGAVKTTIANLDRQITALEENPLLFNKATNEPRALLKVGSVFGSSQAEVDQQSSLQFAYDTALAERARLSTQQAAFIDEFGQPGANQAAFEANKQAASAVSPTLPGIQFEQDTYTLKPGDDLEEVFKAAQELARSTGKPAYVKDPATGEFMVFE